MKKKIIGCLLTLCFAFLVIMLVGCGSDENSNPNLLKKVEVTCQAQESVYVTTVKTNLDASFSAVTKTNSDLTKATFTLSIPLDYEVSSSLDFKFTLNGEALDTSNYKYKITFDENNAKTGYEIVLEFPDAFWSPIA